MISIKKRKLKAKRFNKIYEEKLVAKMSTKSFIKQMKRQKREEQKINNLKQELKGIQTRIMSYSAVKITKENDAIRAKL